MENEHLPRDTRQPFLNLDDSKQTRSNYGSCWLCSEETWSQASPRCSMSHRDPSTAQGCWGGSQAASQKATIFVTASCLQEIIPFPHCTVSEGWLDCCCPRLQFPLKTSHEVPDNQGIASVSFCRILATLQILASSTLFFTNCSCFQPTSLPLFPLLCQHQHKTLSASCSPVHHLFPQ